MANLRIEPTFSTPQQASSMVNADLRIEPTRSTSQQVSSMINADFRIEAISSTPQQVSSMSHKTISTTPNLTERTLSNFMTPNSSQRRRSDIASMKLANKITSVGRPKRSGQTVIGTKKKTNFSKKRNFFDLSVVDQSVKIQTNKTPTEILRKVSYGDTRQQHV